jgi:hypothetical protein
VQVLRDAVEDPSETAAAVAAANAALEEDEWPGLRPPRKRQKRTAPGQAQVRGVPGPLDSPAAVCDVPKMKHKRTENKCLCNAWLLACWRMRGGLAAQNTACCGWTAVIS